MHLHSWFISEGKNLFIPHRETHQKAKLISLRALLIYILIYLILQLSFQIISLIKPGILGTSSNISIQRIIELTNAERERNGLEPLSENLNLKQAASLKADNMFLENYWAHFSPSDRKPWDFILGSGYNFTFAGENLAKNFDTAENVMKAWMNSPTHRDNILNPKYQDIGIAVEDGVLNGQKTTLVVQLFGTTSTLATLPSTKGKLLSSATKVEEKEYRRGLGLLIQTEGKSSQNKQNPLISPLKVSKVLGLFMIGLISLLLLADLYVLKRRGVFRLTSHHLAHMAILSVAGVAIFSSSGGDINQGIAFIYESFR